MGRVHAEFVHSGYLSMSTGQLLRAPNNWKFIARTKPSFLWLALQATFCSNNYDRYNSVSQATKQRIMTVTTILYLCVYISSFNNIVPHLRGHKQVQSTL